MRPGIIIRYNASAGSGKTFKLAGIYLRALFRDPQSYRHILAVTFTNKATTEMKERILHNLYLLACGKKSEYLELITESTGKNEDRVREDASSILNRLLHDYSRFSVGTIDSFFQKVLRSFARESGLQAGFNVILDSEMILMEAVDELLRDAEDDKQLLDWLIEFSNREILEGKSWNLKNKILSLGQEIFREKYRILHEKGYITEDKEKLKSAISDMYVFLNAFRKRLSSLAEEALDILGRNGVEANMLYLKSRSIMKFLAGAVNDIPGTGFRAIEAAADENKYFPGTVAPGELEAALADGLDNCIKSVAKEYRDNIILYNSVKLVLENLYTLGILNDIALRTRKLLTEQNKFLLSDAGDILRRIIASDQAPFIYEKMGTRYKNFMIDEFQDTSRVQWDNFLPLINNSIAEGEDSLVVGDIKQSIYRWRNSDWEIFDRIGESFHPESFKTESLEKNWRSAANIIRFNNAIFSELPARVEKDMDLDADIITKVYSDVVQDDPEKYKDGYVRMKLYDNEDDAKQKAIDDLPGLIEEIQDRGYRACDIGILVRTRNEGQEVIERISRHASSEGHNPKYSYQVISQDSLLLESSPVIIFLISVLKYLVNKEDEVNYAVMHQHYLLSLANTTIDRPLFLYDNSIPFTVEKSTGDFDSFLDSIRYLSVYEILDRLIDFTGLNKIDHAKPYLNTLQNCVLEFAGTETNDLPAFLEWWENEGHKRSVSSTDQTDAMQLMTIHKSKGLQFKVVILPFISWPFRHEVNPFLWIYSDQSMLYKLGAVPVKMKKDFRDTYFRAFYQDEVGRAAIDKLNILYVAFTRARECLYGNLLSTKRGKTAGSYLFDIFSDPEPGKRFEYNKYLDRERGLFTFGKVPVNTSGEEKRQNDPVIDYPLIINDDRLRLKLHSKSFFSERREGEGGKRYYGLLMHEILASVNTAGDVDEAVRLYLKKGVIRYQEYLDVSDKISKALEHEDVKEWFSDDVSVRREKDILVPGGSVRRPDRIIFKEDRIIIVDFKFGNELTVHRKQVSEYKNLLNEMAYERVEAFLWYVDQSRVLAV
ncbi:MAG: UvrD-helicase domain-containing protein [Bacteroidales bacterium]|nr:UvrD-helicase domain-containing protein [Bacteroidales bacterium]